MISRKAVFALMATISLLSLWVVPNVAIDKGNIYLHLLEVLNITIM